MSSSNSTGYRGVYRISARFRAKIYFDGKINDLGTFATAKEAGLAYDHAITHHCLTRKLNFPDGLPLDDEDYEELMHPDKKNRLKSDRTSTYRGVSMHRNKYRAMIYLQSKQKFIGRFDSAKEAALAYDRAVVHHKLSSSKLNFPDGLPLDDEDYDALMNPPKKRRLSSANTTGYTGVSKNGKKFMAQISFDRQTKYLGIFATAKEAALAFDQAVVQHKRPSSKLNFPNDHTSSNENDERSNSDEESDDARSDDESDGGVAVGPSPFPPAQSYFQGDPMLDHLVAAVEAQTNNNK